MSVVLIVCNIFVFRLLSFITFGNAERCCVHRTMVRANQVRAAVGADIQPATSHILYGYVSGVSSIVYNPNARNPVSGGCVRRRLVVVFIVSIFFNSIKALLIEVLCKVYAGFIISMFVTTIWQCCCFLFTCSLPLGGGLGEWILITCMLTLITPVLV